MVIGPLPPPLMGPAIGTEIIRTAFERAGAEVIHVNTQDRRTVFNTGVLDLRNIALAFRHAGAMGWKAARSPVDVVYLPISQGRWGYARDALFFTIAHILRKPIVVHLRGANLQRFYRESTAFERRIIRATLSWSARAVALTPRLRHVYEGLVPAERVFVLENAIPDPWPAGVEHLLRERRRRAEDDPTALRILFVANNFAMKGAPTVVRALADPVLGNARVRMVGAPPPEMAQATEELAGRLGVRGRIELLGGLEGEEKWRQFEWADAFAYPTENDGQPLVVLEAMAAGLPIVASTFGGVPDTVAAAGVLVEPGDDAALAAALRRLIEEPDLRERLGSAARRRFLDRYTPEAFQRRFEALFADLLERAPRADGRLAQGNVGHDEPELSRLRPR